MNQKSKFRCRICQKIEFWKNKIIEFPCCEAAQPICSISCLLKSETFYKIC